MYRSVEDGTSRSRDPKVGQYSVKLQAFEQIALPVLRISVSIVGKKSCQQKHLAYFILKF